MVRAQQSASVQFKARNGRRERRQGGAQARGMTLGILHASNNTDFDVVQPPCSKGIPYASFCLCGCVCQWLMVSVGRRRKEHLKSLEQAQKERTSEQSGEIERLRHQNTELKRENEALKAQLYGLTGNSHMQIPPAPSSHPQHLCYPDSPSVSSTVDSISGAGSPPASLGSEMLPMSSLSLTSAGMPPSMQAYNDAMLLSYFPSQRYSMVTSSSNHDNAKSSPESSDFGSTQPTMGSSNSLQFMNTTQSPMPRSNPGPVRPK